MPLPPVCGQQKDREDQHEECEKAVCVPETSAGPPDVIALTHRKTMDFITCDQRRVRGLRKSARASDIVHPPSNSPAAARSEGYRGSGRYFQDFGFDRQGQIIVDHGAHDALVRLS
jgi:hypothetical protein